MILAANDFVFSFSVHIVMYREQWIKRQCFTDHRILRAVAWSFRRDEMAEKVAKYVSTAFKISKKAK